MRRYPTVVLAAWLCVPAAVPTHGDTKVPESTLIKVLGEELAYSMEKLAMSDGTKPYFMAYAVTEQHEVSLEAKLGTLSEDKASRSRQLDVDVRVGGYKLDNTHKIRGGFLGFDPSDFFGDQAAAISLDDDPVAIRQALWLATDRKFKDAAKKYQRVQTNLKTMVEEEDKADDFSREEPRVYSEPEVRLDLDRASWIERLRKVSRLARQYPLIYGSEISLNAVAKNSYFVNTEGSKLQHGQKYLRIYVTASTKAEDGMELSQYRTFSAASEQGLPGEEELQKAFLEVISQVLALRQAPLVEPYTGPAILKNRASAVFFHEIFGHRIEGHRQKDVEEGQTFTKKIGEKIIPEFISVHDDPTMARWGSTDLRGYYRFDEEGVAAENVTLVDNGVLKTFLLSRSPVQTFAKSNGHGRREPGSKVVSRMGNTIVTSTKAGTFEELRKMLVGECKKQEKPYGLLFEDITGGFTGTRRMGAQTFKVLPVVVYRVYADGRPDELVRGVDIVGTPLMAFSKIIHAADDPDVFNGTCGAESGGIPVSGVSPSVLVSQIEVEKRRREQDKPPLLTPPIAEDKVHP